MRLLGRFFSRRSPHEGAPSRPAARPAVTSPFTESAPPAPTPAMLHALVNSEGQRRRDAEADALRLRALVGEAVGVGSGLTDIVERARHAGQDLAQASRAARERVCAMAVSIDELGATTRTISDQVQTSHRFMAQASDRMVLAGRDLTLLRDSVAEIGSVVGMIGGIARQTNLLALNATIEAARAGEAGRGFAVVAQEVKALSVQTQEATRRVTGIIERLRASALGGIESVAAVEAAIGAIEQTFFAVSEALVIQVTSTAEIASGTSEAVRSVERASAGGHEVLALADELSGRLTGLMAVGERVDRTGSGEAP